ncbi:MAG: SDR family oxidoreductase [Nitrosopumilaceae archaeon]|jgi:NAD(P)-dependent dehydrogenase (short-subunit alcohol dehydrogenase family)|uniref:SDR family oxidoreductase n=3 Tax=Candidatus Nitrosomaritimum aestuariumsis TaxID=3342354 RepID=A0AC60W9Z5_9ARCH|nr:SDR family oxidoreductase [Nitrosopumilaceae archaeon]MBA4454471.1 SDR family oxidoreductase [Nitrosopumilaceae archaeon]MBA4460725.1 SDR family oxidoreductase [Nitrosopumilaceae archaeon]MBA4460939.1 SDR family oxidoreductase [Nitrosopumilaceae archaeon]MBA4464154.1 SDR family oxidoreductase [Nitrosopumilaceae archaeon]
MQKVALVTGSSSGIGYETSIALAKDGYHTFASMRNITKGENLKKIAENENLPISIIELDVDNEKSIIDAIKKIIEDTGRIDVLVNNAGYGQFGCTEDVSVDDFRKQFETNFFSVVRIIQEVAPIMREQNSGIIVNISSVAGRMGLPGSPAYISSKFALEGLGECLRYELGMFGIKTTLIEPGVIKTNFFDSMKIPESKKDPKYQQITENMLAGLKMMVEMGTAPSQVADVVLKAIHDDEVKPRYIAGADAAMFMEAKKSKSDLEFEKYMSKELFPR